MILWWNKKKQASKPAGTPEPGGQQGVPMLPQQDDQREPVPLEDHDVERAKVAEPAPEPEPSAGPPPRPDHGSEPVPASTAQEPMPQQGKGLFGRLADGLARSSARLTGGITGLFTRRKLDREALSELEDLLVASDMGTAAAARIIAGLRKSRFDREVTDREVKEALAEEIAEILLPCEVSVNFAEGPRPRLVLFVGVNGSGKTTTLGKIAAGLKSDGASVLMVAGDTFRAAAIDQLKVWGERADMPVMARAPGADAAGLVYEAFETARREDVALVLVDTAGRLQNRSELMSELAKILRVVRKLDPEAPHDVFLVLDATVGQNALSQVEAFRQTADVTGLIMTKLDGTARGGVLVALAERFRLPVHFIGVGERAEDLQPFSARRFARALVGLDA